MAGGEEPPGEPVDHRFGAAVHRRRDGHPRRSDDPDAQGWATPCSIHRVSLTPTSLRRPGSKVLGSAGRGQSGGGATQITGQVAARATPTVTLLARSRSNG